MGWATSLDAPDGTMTVVGCGSRKWANESAVAIVLERIRSLHPLLTVIEGGARGADLCIGRWAAGMRPRGVAWRHVPARWDDYPSGERWRAAHERNQLMVGQLIDARSLHHGVAVLAFKGQLDPRLFGLHPEDARGGTEHAIRLAWGAEIQVWWCRGNTTPIRCLPDAVPLPGLS